MFDNLLAFLKAPEPEATLSTNDARLALAALLVRVARADQNYDHREIALIDQLLASRYGLAAVAVKDLRHEAEKLETLAPDTVRFTRTIKSAVPYEDRDSVVEALWRVVLADGSRDHEEDGFMRLTANLLGVSDRDSALARRRAQTQG